MINDIHEHEHPEMTINARRKDGNYRRPKDKIGTADVFERVEQFSQTTIH